MKEPKMSPISPYLGCIADDVTGAGDIASMMARRDGSVEQFIGLPGATVTVESEVAVVALKIRTAPVEEAIHQARVAASTSLTTVSIRKNQPDHCR